MWLGEQITARGVGNGISLIIFAGIVAELPNYIVPDLGAALCRPARLHRRSSRSSGLAAALVLFIVFIERSQRRLLIQYPKRQQGNRMVGGESSFLPLKVNSAGVIPPIFASSLLMLPNTLAGFNNPQAAAVPPLAVTPTRSLPRQSGWWGDVLSFIQAYLGPGQPLHIVVYRRADHLLLLLLHLDRLQSGRDGGEPAQVWRVHSGLSPRQADGRASRLRADPPHRASARSISPRSA